MADDDLTSLLTAPPVGPAQNMMYRQGIVTSWNLITLENTVNVGGTILTNLPVLGVGEAATIGPGSVVGIMTVGSTWAIIGRIVTPNTPEANDATALLSAQTKVAYASNNISTTSATFVSLDQGPSVTGLVRNTGRCLVFSGGLITGGSELIGSTALDTAAMAVKLTGANVLAASNEWQHCFTTSITPSAGTVAFINTLRGVGAHLFENLTPGETTFEMQYHSHSSGTLTADFADRILAVIFL